MFSANGLFDELAFALRATRETKTSKEDDATTSFWTILLYLLLYRHLIISSYIYLNIHLPLILLVVSFSVAEKLAMRPVSLRLLRVSPVSVIIPQVFRTSFI